MKYIQSQCIYSFVLVVHLNLFGNGLVLTGKNITDIEWNSNSNTAKFWSNGKLVHSFNANTFTDTALSLSENQLSNISQAFLQQLSTLDTLNLSSNALTSIKDEFINTNFSTIDLSRNKIATIQAGAFEGCNRLKMIFLGSNQLQKLSDPIFPVLNSVLAIDLQNNQLQSIADTVFATLSRLIFLFLNENQLQTIPSLQSSPKIREIQAMRNQFTDIPRTVRSLPSLAALHLSHNKIHSIPSNLFTSSSSSKNTLKQLYLVNNTLTSIDIHAFTGIELLQELDLSFNLLSSIEFGTFAPLYELTVLKLDHNRLSSFEDFNRLSEVLQLSLSYNMIRDLPVHLQDVVPNLKMFNLSYNSLSAISNGAFDGLTSLTLLLLQNNTISRIDDFALTSLSNTLEYMDISNNQISGISQVALTSMFPKANTNVSLQGNPGLLANNDQSSNNLSCATGSLMQTVTFTNTSIIACIWCKPGSYHNKDTNTCTPCTARGYTAMYGASICRVCPLVFTLNPFHDGCEPLRCNAVCYLSIACCLLFPFLLLCGKSCLASFWVYARIQDEKKEAERHLQELIRSQILADTSRSLDTLDDEEKDAILRVMSDDLQLQTVYIEWSKIQVIKPLAVGAYGEVSLAEYCGGQVAIKRLISSKLNARGVVDFAQEIHIMMNLRHPSIIQFIGVTWNESYDLCAISEYMPKGDLFKVLNNKTYQLTWAEHKLRILYDAFLAVAYMHGFEPPIIHRDLKSRNILINEDFTCKLSDFGLSKPHDQDATMTSVGTYSWLAPEMIKGERFNESIDVYSLGIVIVELISHELPYYNAMHNGKKLQGLALSHHVAFCGLKPLLPANWKSSVDVMDIDLFSLINRCTDHVPENRPKSWQVAEELKRVVLTQHELDVLADRCTAVAKKMN